MDEGIVVSTAPDEIGAELVCGLLRSAGIECGHRATEATDSAFEGIASDGPREILVHRTDAEAARAVLAETQR
jgi:hypothetical protein